MGEHNIFQLETRIEQLFETLFPRYKPGESGHPSGRAYKPILESTLGALVPGGNASRQLQQRREYVKVDFPDFIDYATSTLPTVPRLADFPDQTAVFYESISPGAGQWAVWGDHKFSIRDAVVARDKVFVSVTMRFDVSLNWQDGTSAVEELGATITFAPEWHTRQAVGPLGEWERATWMPRIDEDDDYRITNSGEFTSHVLDQIEAGSKSTYSAEQLTKLRAFPEAHRTTWGAFFEVVRLGLHLHTYVDFMYDVVVTERTPVGVKPSKNRQPRRGRPVSFDKPIYKIIRSVRIIRAETSPKQTAEYRQWTAPSYSFLVRGHWRHFEDAQRLGRDADGNPVTGKTWVREYRKFDEQGEQHTMQRDPRVVIGIKQTLSYARELIETGQHEHTEANSPSVEWMASERSKLTAGLRYLILKRDGFKCCKCGKTPANENHVRLEVDHKVPVSQWGRTLEDNLETLCRDCNRGKGTR